MAAQLQDTAQSTIGQELPRAPPTVTADMSMKPDSYTCICRHPGNYTTYADHFSELASQLRGLNPTHLMYTFLNGLTADYKQHVLLHNAT